MNALGLDARRHYRVVTRAPDGATVSRKDR